MIYQLAFELRLSQSQIFHLKFENIKNGYNNKPFKFNSTQIYRPLSFYSSSILKYMCISNNKCRGQYIIFDEIRSSKMQFRMQLCNKKIKNIIKKEIKLKKELSNKTVKLLENEKPRVKNNSIYLILKSIFLVKYGIFWV